MTETKYVIVSDIDIFFLFNSWLKIFSKSRPEKIFLKTPKKHPFFKYLIWTEKIIYGLSAVGLLAHFLVNFLSLKRKGEFLGRIVRFESWQQISGYLNTKQDIERVYITTGSIVPSWFLAEEKCTVINKHAGDTRIIRGLLPAFWSLFYGFPLSVTVHLVDDKIDNGRPLLIKNVEGRRVKSLLSFYKYVYFDIWPELFYEIHGVSFEYQQDNLEGDAIYRSWPTSSDFDEFRAKSALPLCRFSDIIQ